MDAHHAPDWTTAQCPRCGYDQRGLIAAWRESCPLEITCAECGLHYLSAEVLCPHKFEPRWCVEYCFAEPGRFFRACAVTVAQSCLPSRFWSRLKMSDRMRPRRLALYLLVLLLPFLVIYLAAQTWVAVHVRESTQQRLAFGAQRFAGWMAQNEFIYDARPEALEEFKNMHPDMWEELLEERRLAHAVNIERAQAAAENPPYMKSGPLLHILEAVFRPLARESWLTITYQVPDTEFPYTAPYELWDEAAVYILGGGALGRWRWVHALDFAAHGMLFGVALGLLFPVSLALLPLSRKKAKVRWAHIARITAYWAFIPAMTFYLVVALLAGGLLYAFRTGSAPGVGIIVTLIGVGAIPVGTVLWWMFAIDRHLKMPRALAVTSVLLFLCFLIVMAVVYLLLPHWILGPEAALQ